MATKQTLPRLFSGPFSKRGFEQTVPNFSFKKCSRINRRRPSILLPQPESVIQISEGSDSSFGSDAQRSRQPLPAVNRAKAGAFAYVFASNFFTGLSSVFQ